MTQELFRAMIQGLGEGPYLPPTLSCHSTCVDVTLDSCHWLPRTFYPVKMLCREKQQGRHPLSGPGPRPFSEGQTRISRNHSFAGRRPCPWQGGQGTRAPPVPGSAPGGRGRQLQANAFPLRASSAGRGITGAEPLFSRRP